VTATRLLFFAAWIVAVFSFCRFAPLGSRPRLLAASVIGFGCCLFFLGLWAQPDAVPQYFGTITPRTRTLFSSARSNLPRNGIWGFWSPTGVGWPAERGNDEDSWGLRAENRDRTRTGESLHSNQKKNGNLVAELRRNEWQVSPNSWDRNYTKDAVEVIDSTGKVVLRVRALPDRTKLQGEWWSTDGRGIRIVKARNQ
jgi:hypothetical protein